MSVRELCASAVEAALAAGASYADARAVLRRSQAIATKNGRVDELSDAESEGIGVRVLVGGAWGFAADHRLEPSSAREAAERACGFARAAPGSHDRILLPAEPQQGSYRTQVVRDPFDVSPAEKVELCLRAEKALEHPGVTVRQAAVRAQRELKLFVSSDGSEIEQELVECGGGIDAIAVGDGLYQIRSYPSAHVGSSAQAGWEYVEGLALEREAPRVGEQAAALLQAEPCPEGVTTVVIDAEQAQLQVHESVGHPIELDRIYGTEAAYAGTSFLKPDDLDSLRYGSPLMNVTADPTTPGGVGTFGWDDEGVQAEREPIVVDGVLRSFLTSRESAARLGPGRGPFDELLADVDEGVYLETNKSWSIDDKRLNFQFGTQVAWEIRNGRLGRMLRDATYTGITPLFWGSLDAVAGPDTWRLHGLTNCGKGQPGQHAHVSHGAPAARFRNVQVGVHA